MPPSKKRGNEPASVREMIGTDYAHHGNIMPDWQQAPIERAPRQPSRPHATGQPHPPGRHTGVARRRSRRHPSTRREPVPPTVNELFNNINAPADGAETPSRAPGRRSSQASTSIGCPVPYPCHSEWQSPVLSGHPQSVLASTFTETSGRRRPDLDLPDVAAITTGYSSSSSSASVRAWSAWGNMWPYTPRVTRMVACPMRCMTATGLTPASMRQAA